MSSCDSSGCRHGARQNMRAQEMSGSTAWTTISRIAVAIAFARSVSNNLSMIFVDSTTQFVGPPSKVVSDPRHFVFDPRSYDPRLLIYDSLSGFEPVSFPPSETSRPSWILPEENNNLYGRRQIFYFIFFIIGRLRRLTIDLPAAHKLYALRTPASLDFPTSSTTYQDL